MTLDRRSYITLLSFFLATLTSTLLGRDGADLVHSRDTLPVYTQEQAVMRMKGSHVVFGGTVRNVGKYLSKILPSLDVAGAKFASFHVVVYENDSTDETRQSLRDHAKSRQDFTLIFEDGVNEEHRTNRIAYGRNKVLNAVRSLRIPDPAYLVMIDMDSVNSEGTFAETIDTCFAYDNWNAQFSNQRNTYYHDPWALREPGGLDYDCWERYTLTGDFWASVIKWLRKRPEQEALIPVYSAFGGTGIYRLAAIPDDATYSGYSEPRYPGWSGAVCEHVPFHSRLTRLFINTKFYND
jgi:glycosyltransferase involved in cell wall biosynthesis